MSKDGLANFFLGLGIGVGVGLLFAPQSGEHTREFIKSKADEGKDFLKRQSEDLRERADNLTDKGRDVVSRQRDNLSDALAAGKQAYREKIDSMTDYRAKAAGA